MESPALFWQHKKHLQRTAFGAGRCDAVCQFSCHLKSGILQSVRRLKGRPLDTHDGEWGT